MNEKLTQIEAILSALTGSQGVSELEAAQVTAALTVCQRLAFELLSVIPAVDGPAQVPTKEEVLRELETELQRLDQLEIEMQGSAELTGRECTSMI